MSELDDHRSKFWKDHSDSYDCYFCHAVGIACYSRGDESGAWRDACFECARGKDASPITAHVQRRKLTSEVPELPIVTSETARTDKIRPPVQCTFDGCLETFQRGRGRPSKLGFCPKHRTEKAVS